MLPLKITHRYTLTSTRLNLMARQAVEGGKWNRTVRTRGMVRGVTPQQDGIGCYATGHQSYLYTGPLVPPFSSPSSNVTDVYALGFD